MHNIASKCKVKLFVLKIFFSSNSYCPKIHVCKNSIVDPLYSCEVLAI